ncbi:hypothetical protein BVY04_04420 [bacterium M21]|nr:hypothetical protein BVY04_04420 [bacterium M21]
MTNRQRIELESGGIWLAPPEYVITRKLEYYREGGSDKHLHDIRCMLDVSSDLIDQDKLTEFMHDFRLEKEWEEMQKGQLPLF